MDRYDDRLYRGQGRILIPTGCWMSIRARSGGLKSSREEEEKDGHGIGNY